MLSVGDLLRGSVVETTRKSWTGPLFYSDAKSVHDTSFTTDSPELTTLNLLALYPIVGIAAGVLRMILATIHCIGHLLLAAFLKHNKGHLYHAAKGGCEFLRGFIEALPIAGRIFSWYYCQNKGYWWMIKIYNPQNPDYLDSHMHNWQDFAKNRPTAYVMA